MTAKTKDTKKAKAVFGAIFWEIVASIVLPKVVGLVESKVKANAVKAKAKTKTRAKSR
jgi:predicted Na+-dependent transporter